MSESASGRLELKNVTLKKESIQSGENGVKTYGTKCLLDNLSMTVREGVVHAMIGPNGAGKSTLAYTIMGLEGYTGIDGDILYDGESITWMSVSERARKGISIAWQEPARFEGVTVRKFLEVSASTRELSSKELSSEIDHALSIVGLSSRQYLSRYVDASLSGGERNVQS